MTLAVLVNEIRLRLRRFSEVDPHEAIRLVNGDALVVDVRNREQFASGHIINARNIPLGEIDQHIKSLVRKSAKRTIITCGEVGAIGAKAAATLKKSGLVNVVNLKGGISAWQRDNLPLRKGK